MCSYSYRFSFALQENTPLVHHPLVMRNSPMVHGQRGIISTRFAHSRAFLSSTETKYYCSNYIGLRRALTRELYESERIGPRTYFPVGCGNVLLPTHVAPIVPIRGESEDTFPLCGKIEVRRDNREDSFFPHYGEYAGRQNVNAAKSERPKRSFAADQLRFAVNSGAASA